MKKFLISLLAASALLATVAAWPGYVRQYIATEQLPQVTILAHAYPSHAYSHIVYCGTSWVYISAAQQAIVDEALRRGTNMVLKVAGAYVASPCF